MTNRPGKENTSTDAPATGCPASAVSVSNDHLQFSDVLAEEYKALYRPLSPVTAARLKEAKASQNGRPDDSALCKVIYDELHQYPGDRSALCFSGGGIRSATFNLGVIQALAKLNLLDKFDYLSTVSGGGYIGSWLTACAYRYRESGKEGIKDVQEFLKTLDGTSPHTQTGVEPTPIVWLRDFSNYLTPKLGFFSADSWTMYGTYLRNLLLNWLVLIPLIIASLMIPRLQVAALRHPFGFAPGDLLWVGLLLIVPSLTYLHFYRPSLSRLRENKNDPAPGSNKSKEWLEGLGCQGWFVSLCLVPLVLAAYCLTTAWAWYQNLQGSLSDVAVDGRSSGTSFTITGAAVHVLSWSAAMLLTTMLAAMRDRVGTCVSALLWKGAKEIIPIALSGVIGGLAIWAVLDQMPDYLSVYHYAEWYAVFAVPGFLGLFLLVATLFIGLTGRFTSDQEHEFWGRTGSWVLNAGMTIGAIGATIIFGPGLLAKAGIWTSASIGGVAGIISLAGGFSAKTLLAPSEMKGRGSWWTEYGVRVATPLFVILLIVGFALGTSALVKAWSGFLDIKTDRWEMAGEFMPEPDPYRPWIHSLALYNVQFNHLLWLWSLLLSIGLTMGLFINVNKFSLHGFYRNRLIRAYLGASRELLGQDTRKPNLLTGFDPGDNVYMAELAKEYGSNKQESKTAIQRPFHVVNIALNLVRSERLAWQQRKAQSFTVSPLHCGSWQDLGYRRSHEYGYNGSINRAISLGTAMATSGAAASPNMGYHSSPAVTFLLALFNIRLGWWLGNPGKAGGKTFLGGLGRWLNLWPSYHRSHPAFSMGPLVAELFGFTDASRRYVYLSDGGHFENLALYEMVLRRCHYIVVIDAGCDPALSFQDLGNAIRKVRIDQGIDIEINTDMIKPQGGSQYSRWHHAVGSIRYDKVDPGAPVGTLLYLKASLAGEEPSDVQDYAVHHKAFPHEPTSDQFFDESQFESYRRLGEHIADKVFSFGLQNGATQSDQLPLSEVIRQLQKHWVSVPPGVQDSFLRETQALMDLEKQLRVDPGLARYDQETYPEILSVFGVDPEKVAHTDARSSLHLCCSQMQLMENVFLGVRLGEHYAHPMNRGWMNLFRRWANAGTFRQWWPILCGSFNPAFVEFSRRHLYLECDSSPVLERQPLSDDEIRRISRQINHEWPKDKSVPQDFEEALYKPIQLILSPMESEPAVWIARIQGNRREVVGVVCLSGVSQGSWQIHGWIRPGYRGLGIGHSLFRKALEDVQKSLIHHGLGSLELIAHLGLDEAALTGLNHPRAELIRFYERLKFRRIPEKKSPEKKETSRLRLSLHLQGK